MNQTGTGAVFIPLFFGLVFVFGGTLLCACLLSGGRLDAESAKMAVYGCLGADCFFTSFLGARRATAKKLLFGLLPVLCLLGCLFLLALSWKGEPIQPVAAAAVSGICLISALLGVISGTLLRTKHK